MATDSENVDPRQAAVVAGEALLTAVQRHVAMISAGGAADPALDELDDQLWDAVAAYGEALDILNDQAETEPPEPTELRFTVRTRYDYTVTDEKSFLAAGQGIGPAVLALLERAGGKPISALEVGALETGSGLLTVHLNNEPLNADDFQVADEPTDLLLIAPNETLAFTLDEPVYESRAEAEAAAKRANEN